MKRYRVTLAADVMAESAQQARNAVTEVKFAVEPCDWGVLHVEEVPNSQVEVPNK